MPSGVQNMVSVSTKLATLPYSMISFRTCVPQMGDTVRLGIMVGSALTIIVDAP